jgi:hypothetical protein
LCHAVGDGGLEEKHPLVIIPTMTCSLTRRVLFRGLTLYPFPEGDANVSVVTCTRLVVSDGRHFGTAICIEGRFKLFHRAKQAIATRLAPPLCPLLEICNRYVVVCVAIK